MPAVTWTSCDSEKRMSESQQSEHGYMQGGKVVELLTVL